MGSSKEWSVDFKKHIVSHENGLAVEILDGKVIDIVNIPRGLPTRELPRLIDEAAAVYAERRSGPSQRTKISSKEVKKVGPRKPTLSLRKKEESGQ